MRKLLFSISLILVSVIGISQSWDHYYGKIPQDSINGLDSIQFLIIDAVDDSTFYVLFSQLDTIWLSASEAAAMITGNTDEGITVAYQDADGTIDFTVLAYHAFLYFGDSAVSKSYTTNWARLTNTGDSLFIQEELDGFTVSNDTITITNAGDYIFTGIFTHDGDNGETVSIRFYNVTQAAGVPVAGAQTMRAANNFGSTSVEGYDEISAGDKIVIQYKGDASGTAVFKNSAVLIHYLHQ